MAPTRSAASTGTAGSSPSRCRGGLTRYPIPTAGGTPYQVHLGPDGALWFTEIEGNKIGRLRPRPA